MIENNLLSDTQPGRSCITQLLQVLDKWTEILDRGGVLDVYNRDYVWQEEELISQQAVSPFHSRLKMTMMMTSSPV